MLLIFSPFCVPGILRIGFYLLYLYIEAGDSRSAFEIPGVFAVASQQYTTHLVGGAFFNEINFMQVLTFLGAVVTFG